MEKKRYQKPFVEITDDVVYTTNLTGSDEPDKDDDFGEIFYSFESYRLRQCGDYRNIIATFFELRLIFLCMKTLVLSM